MPAPSAPWPSPPRSGSTCCGGVPTLQEAGLPGFDLASWNAIWMPAGTPAAVVARLNREVVAIGGSDEAKRFMAAMGIASTTSTPAALGAFNAAELARWAGIAAEARMARE